MSLDVENPIDKFCHPGVEKSVLSCIVRSPNLLVSSSKEITSEHFLSPSGREMFICLGSLYVKGVECFSVDAIWNEAKNLKTFTILNTQDGYEFIKVVIDSLIPHTLYEYYLNELIERADKYRLYVLTEKFKDKIVRNVDNVKSAMSFDDLVGNLEADVYNLTVDANQTKDAVDFSKYVVEFVEKLKSPPIDILGVRSGFTALDRLLNGFKPGSLYIVAARAKQGKCLSGDTLILDADSGTYKPIKSFTGKVATFENGVFSRKKVIGPIFSGEKEVFLIKTRTGKEIKATSNHPFLSPAGWLNIDSGLKIGTRIGVAASLPFFGDKSIDLNKLGFLAYWLSEGTRKYSSVTAGRKEVIRDFISIVESQGGSVTKVRKKFTKALTLNPLSYKGNKINTIKGLDIPNKIDMWLEKNSASYLNDFKEKYDVTSIYNIYKSGFASSESINKFEKIDKDIFSFNEDDKKYLNSTGVNNQFKVLLKDFGVDIESFSYEKELPQIVYSLNKECLAYFLNRLFSGDGWVCNAEIGFGSSSEKLVDGVISLLLKFGIYAIKSKRASYYTNSSKERITARESFALSITKKRFMLKFIEEIGCIGRKKEIKKVKTALLKRKDGDVFGNPPKEFFPIIKELCNINQVSLSSVERKTGAYLRSNRGVGNSFLYKIGECLNNTKLKELASPNIYWDEVTSIEKLGKEAVYDLQVIDGEPNFVANDIVVHNSSLLLEWAKHLAFFEGVPVLYIDTEMNKELMMRRLYAQLTQISIKDLENNTYSHDPVTLESIDLAMDIVQNGNFKYKNLPRFSPELLRFEIKKFIKQNTTGVVVFDYIKLPDGLDLKVANETQQLGYLTTALKALANELEIPILSAVQFNRDAVGRDPKSNYISGSDRILHYADTLMAIRKLSPKEIAYYRTRYGSYGAIINGMVSIMDSRSTSAGSGVLLEMNLDKASIKEASDQVIDNAEPTEYSPEE